MAKRKTPMEWAYEHAGHLRNKAKEIEDGPAKDLITDYIGSLTESDYQVGHWTILKNISLAYCLTPFGIILDSNKITNTLYLDPFSGSGIAPLKDSPDSKKLSWTVGSPIISTMMTDYPFSLYEFGDISSKSIRNLDELFNEYDDMGLQINRNCIDANELIQACCANHQNKYIFAYLDQSGFQLKWKSLEAIFRIRKFDIFLNYQTRLVERLPDDKIREFFGPAHENVPKCSNCDEILEVYLDEIRKRGLYVTPIRIGKDRTDQYYYHLIHISPKDSYDSIVNGLKNKIESFQGESIKTIWNDLAGFSQQQSLF
jgi:three-Cys-motif partner protein